MTKFEVDHSIADHLTKLQKPFLATLSEVVNGYGWEDGLFTAKSLCAVSVYALYDGLKDKIDPLFALKAMGMKIYFNKEYLGGAGGFYRELFGFHSILQISHPSGEAVYVDPTYGQISQPWAGQFLISASSTIGQYYQTEAVVGAHWDMDQQKRPVTETDLWDVTAEKEKQLKYFEEKLGITDFQYALLVQSIMWGKI